MTESRADERRVVGAIEMWLEGSLPADRANEVRDELREWWRERKSDEAFLRSLLAEAAARIFINMETR